MGLVAKCLPKDMNLSVTEPVRFSWIGENINDDAGTSAC